MIVLGLQFRIILVSYRHAIGTLRSIPEVGAPKAEQKSVLTNAEKREVHWMNVIQVL